MDLIILLLVKLVFTVDGKYGYFRVDHKISHCLDRSVFFSLFRRSSDVCMILWTVCKETQNQHCHAAREGMEELSSCVIMF